MFSAVRRAKQIEDNLLNMGAVSLLYKITRLLHMNMKSVYDIMYFVI